MRSKIAKRIQNETPEAVRIFVRQYTDIAVRINEIMEANGYTQKDRAERMRKRPLEINKWNLEAELGEPIIFKVKKKLAFQLSRLQKSNLSKNSNRIY
jgi:hypothetical protein